LPATIPTTSHLRLRHHLLLGRPDGDAGHPLHGEAPWKTLYLHGLVRDSKGAKMSKSKGNTVDPLGLIDRYGADALRFTLAAMESQGRDIKLDEKRIEAIATSPPSSGTRRASARRTASAPRRSWSRRRRSCRSIAGSSARR
jgi:cysteinyl-tRNA synthetase